MMLINVVWRLRKIRAYTHQRCSTNPCPQKRE